MATILKIHTAAAHTALRSDLTDLANAPFASESIDPDVVRNLIIQIAPEPDAYPFAIEIPWGQMHFPLRAALAASGHYSGDVVLYSDADDRASISDIVLHQMSSQHVATLLEAIETSTTIDFPNAVMRKDLYPAGEPMAGALVDQRLLPDISHALRQGYFLSRFVQRRNDANRHFAWLDEKADGMTPEVKLFSEANAFSIYHSGGGCLALMRDESPDWHVLWTDSDSGLPTSIADPENYFGVHHNESGWWLATSATAQDFIHVRATLLALAQQLYVPDRDGFHDELPSLLKKAAHLGLVAEDEIAHVAEILGRPQS